MEQIIAGKFGSIAKADAVALLLSKFIRPIDICIFYDSPQGHAGIGAYTGSLFGAKYGMKAKVSISEHTRHQADVILTVNVENPSNKALIVATLKKAGTKEYEIAKGIWRHGEGMDFNSEESPQRVSLSSHLTLELAAS